MAAMNIIGVYLEKDGNYTFFCRTSRGTKCYMTVSNITGAAFIEIFVPDMNWEEYHSLPGIEG